MTPYLEREGKVMTPELPDRCPAWSGPEDRPCRLTIRHWRRRKTGPRIPLAVVWCGTHGGGAFTLYPPGHVPYGRKPVLLVAPEGSPVHGEGDDRLRRDFGGTLFEAALDARDGRSWPRSTDGRPQHSWGTQGRHLGIAARVLGLVRELADGVRERIAAVLSVDLLQLREGLRAKGYRSVGAAVCGVLARLRGGARRALRLMFCGHLVRRWGEPRLWDPKRGMLERLPFQRAPTGAVC